jgi:hypothetical protein
MLAGITSIAWSRGIFWFLMLSNRYFDYKEPEIWSGVVSDKDSSRYGRTGEKAGKSYKLGITVDRKSYTMRVTSIEFNDAYVNQSVRLTIRNGLFGFAWFDKVEPKIPGDRARRPPVKESTVHLPKVVTTNPDWKPILSPFFKNLPSSNGKKCFSMHIIDDEAVTSDECPEEEK